MDALPQTPLSSIENTQTLRSLDPEGTPVGDRDRSPKIQLCIEIRKREKNSKGNKNQSFIGYSNSKNQELMLEVTVMHVKNLIPKSSSDVFSALPTSKKTKDVKRSRPTFIKIRVVPGNIIHRTEVKMDEQNKDKLDLKFIEVFSFPLESLEILAERKLEVSVCNNKMTRNSITHGKVVVDLGNYKIGKPVCKWFTVIDSHPPSA